MSDVDSYILEQEEFDFKEPHIFYQEKSRLAFFNQYEFHRPILYPVFEKLDKEYQCIFSSDEKEIINFKPHLIVQADYSYQLFRKYLPGTLLVNTLHGFGTKNYWKRGIPHYDFVCLPNPWIGEQCKRQRINPKISMWLTGFVPTDKIFNSSKSKKDLPGEVANHSIILYAPTWTKRLTSVDVLGDEWIENLIINLKNVSLIIKPHPHMSRDFPDLIKKWKNISTKNSRVFLIENPDENIYEYFHLADILLADASSVMFYFLALNRPIILVSNPERTNEKKFFDDEGAEWKWRDMGIEIQKAEELIPAVEKYLKNPSLHSDTRAFYLEKVFGSLKLGEAAINTAKYIRDFLNPPDKMGKIWAASFKEFSTRINSNSVIFLKENLGENTEFDKNLAFEINDAYKKALGRDADQDGLVFFYNKIQSGHLKIENLVAELRKSRESQN